MKELTREPVDHGARHRSVVAALIAARRQAGMTQLELAARLVRAHSFVAKIEGGSQQLKVLELLDFADALDVDPVDLLRQVVIQRHIDTGVSATAESGPAR